MVGLGYGIFGEEGGFGVVVWCGRGGEVAAMGQMIVIDAWFMLLVWVESVV